MYPGMSGIFRAVYGGWLLPASFVLLWMMVSYPEDDFRRISGGDVPASAECNYSSVMCMAGLQLIFWKWTADFALFIREVLLVVFLVWGSITLIVLYFCLSYLLRCWSD